jgi:hypothetical protein
MCGPPTWWFGEGQATPCCKKGLLEMSKMALDLDGFLERIGTEKWIRDLEH